jgi:hypothetical protein
MLIQSVALCLFALKAINRPILTQALFQHDNGYIKSTTDRGSTGKRKTSMTFPDVCNAA